MVVFLALIRGFFICRILAGGSQREGLPLICPGGAKGGAGPGAGGAGGSGLLASQITGAPGRCGNGEAVGHVQPHRAGAKAERLRSVHPEALDILATGLPRPSLAPGSASPPPPLPCQPPALQRSRLTHCSTQPSLLTAIGCSSVSFRQVPPLWTWEAPQRLAPRPQLAPPPPEQACGPPASYRKRFGIQPERTLVLCCFAAVNPGHVT